MKRFLYVIIIATFLLVVSGAIVYKFFLPGIIAEAVATEQLPAFIPQRIRTKIGKVNKPLNENAREIIATIHKSGITFDQIVKAIDDAKEEQAYALLDELNRTNITNIDQLFDMGKRHFPVDFDVEVFREAYRKKATIPLIEKAIRYANKYKDEKLMDAQTAKETAKKILRTKEVEFNKIVGGTKPNH